MLDDRQYMRNEYRPPWSIVSILLVANIVCYILQSLLAWTVGDRVVNDFLALSADGLRQWRVYQLVTFQFLHGSLFHLLGNLLGLYFFGRAIEEMMGGKGLLKLYLLSGTIGGLLQVALGYLAPRFGGPVVGASAGVFGLVAAFAVSRPNQPITLLIFFILPVTFKAKFILAFEAVITILGLGNPSSQIAHGAHLGGMLTGIAYIYWMANSSGPQFRWLRFFRRNPSRPRVIITPPKSSWRSGPKKKLDDLPPAEFMSREVDPILEKISARGIHSLTDEERRILEDARSRMARR